MLLLSPNGLNVINIEWGIMMFQGIVTGIAAIETPAMRLSVTGFLWFHSS